MTTFTHMHHEMANKALLIEASRSSDYWNVNKSVLRDIVMSGSVDPKSKWLPVVVTDVDRALVLQYLEA